MGIFCWIVIGAVGGMALATAFLFHWTSRKAMARAKENAARFSEAMKYAHASIDEAPHGFILADEERTIIHVNDAYCRMTGRSREDLVGKRPPFPGWAPEEYEMILSRWEGVVRGDAEPIEVMYVKPNGERFPAQFSPGITRTSDGKTYFFATVRDLTEEKRLEETLSESEAKFRRIVETSADVIYQLDLDGKVTYISPCVEAILGISPEEFVGTYFQDHFRPEDLPPVEKARAENLRGAAVRQREFRILNKSGEPVDIEISATTIRKDGKVIGSQGIARDITDRKEADAALRESEAKLKAQFKGLPVPVFAYQKKGDDIFLVDCNDAAVEMTRGKITAWLPCKAAEFHADRSDIIEYLERCFEEKESRHVETKYRLRTTGETKHLSLTIGYVEPDVVLVHTEDITARKEVEEKLAASEAKQESIFQGLPVPVYAWQRRGDDFVLVDCNEAAVRITEGKIKELLGITARELYADRPHLQRDLETCFEEKRSVQRDMCYHFKTTGAVKHLSVTVGYVEPDMVLVHTEDVTARKEIEEKLAASEARLRTVLESVPFDLLLIDESGRYVMQNAASQKTWGNVTGKLPEEVATDPETLALWRDNNQRAFSGEIVRGEASYKLLGKDRHVYNIISPVYSRDGIRDVAIVNIDITDLKLAEKALRESEEKYRFLVENTGTAVSFWDTEGKLLIVNRIAARYLGSTPERMIGKTVHDFVPKEQADKLRARQQEVLKSGAGLETEEHVNTATGERWFRSYLQPVKDAEGRLFGVQIVSHDVTDLARAERALRESDARLRMMASQVPAVLWTVDRELRFTSSAGLGLETLGLSPGQVVGKTLYYYFNTNDPEFPPIASHRRALTGEPVSYETTWKDRVWETQVEALRDEKGEIVGCVGMGLDVTERKLAEEEVAHSREQLRALAKRLHEVREEESTGIAREIHDELGQALTGLKLDLEFIKRRLGRCGDPRERAKLDEKIKEMYATIDAEVNVVRGISTRLRIKALDDLGLIGAVEMYSQEFRRRTGIPCDVNQYGVEVMESELDSQRKTSVFRILQEILTNVRRHAAATHVWVDLRGEEESLILEVRDNGKGIPAERLARLDGLGVLGMRERAQAFGGHVKIDSEPGKGTSVSVTIPLRDSP